MTFVYVDTSALVKRYVAETDAEAVDAVMNEALRVGTSLITRTEVAAALAKAVRQGRLREVEGGKHTRDSWRNGGTSPECR